MPTVLFISPHLDDVAFSCGGSVIAFGRAGWRVVVVTAFTASVPSPQGFALACQLDKGLPGDVDYLAIRRREDEDFAARAGVAATVWLDLPEAPHRGYDSATALFGAFARVDDVAPVLADRLGRSVGAEQPDLVFAPQALGAHVDHRRVAEAVAAVADPGAVRWYQDLPYAIRDPAARSPLAALDDLREEPLDVTATIDAKGHAVAAYRTQLGFQFDGPSAAARRLRDHARVEAVRLGVDGAVEVVRRTA